MPWSTFPGSKENGLKCFTGEVGGLQFFYIRKIYKKQQYITLGNSCMIIFSLFIRFLFFFGQKKGTLRARCALCEVDF